MYISRVEKGLKLIDISPSRNVNTYGGAVTREPHERLKHWGRPRASYVSWGDGTFSFQPWKVSLNAPSQSIHILNLELINIWIKVFLFQVLCRVRYLYYHPSLPVSCFPSESSPSPNMQNMSRRFGRMTTKSSADDSQIAVLLKDFDDADMLLGKVILPRWRASCRIS